MYLDLTDRQRQLQQDIHAAVREHLPGGTSTGRAPFAREEWRTAGKLGLLGLCLPTEYGGGGLGALDTALALESFGRGCTDMGLVFAVSAHLLACAVPVRDFADPALREQLLPGLVSGELVAANAMTEDDAGSDVGNLTTTARRSGREYVLAGEKSFASNAPASDVLVTYAVTEPRDGFLGISAFVVDRHTPGVEIVGPFQKMGLDSCPAGRVHFHDVRVPAENLLGSEGQGGLIFQHSMGWERACLFAGYLGLMERQLAQCVAHARTRRQFGRPLSAHQAVSHRIAAMRRRLEGARLLLYRACWLLDQDRADPAALALSKVAVSEAAVANGLDAVRVFGGRGYQSGEGVEATLRDAVPSTIFSGTNEIHNELIAQGMGL